MASTDGLQKISYLCVTCKQTINKLIDKEVHLARQELKINGLASYIDVHDDKDGKKHGLKLFIDPNFHVRTNHSLKDKEEKKTSAIPMPGFKTTNLNTKYSWKTWVKLELALKNESIKFDLQLDKEASPEERTVMSKITEKSTLGFVECNVDALVSENAKETFGFISKWMKSLCNSLELAAAIHIDLIPEVLRYVDTHVYRELTKLDENIMAILIDKASILIPNKDTFEMLQKYGPGLELIELSSAQFTKIAVKLSNYERFTMRDVQEILSDEVNKDAELEEEIIILALFYLLSMKAFDYKLSYLHKSADED